MFSVLVIADDAGFFRRRRLFRAPQVRDVRVYGGLPFREIISARRAENKPRGDMRSGWQMLGHNASA